MVPGVPSELRSSSVPRRLLATPDRNSGALYLLGVGLAGYALVAIILAAPWSLAPLGGFVMLALLVAFIARPVPTLALVVVLLGSAGLPLGSKGWDIGIRVYPLDFILLVLLVGLVIGTLLAHEVWNHQWPLRGWYWTLLGYLVFSLAHGVAAGHGARDALGDFRRMAIYPMALFVIAGVAQRPQAITVLFKAVVWASYATVAIAAVRVVAGVGYAEQHLAGTTIRYLSYVEASTAGLGVLVLLGLARAAEGQERLRYTVAAVPPFVAVLVSNYRTAWIALAAGMLVAFGSLGWRRGLRMGLLGVLLMVPVAYGLVSYTALGQGILDRFNAMNATTSGLWRYFSWIAAISAWLAHPVLGTGLGYAHHFEFYDILAGEYTASTTSSIHNDPLWFLVNNGLLGVGVAARFLIPWLRRARLLARGGDPFQRLVGSTALGALTLMVVVSCLQPYFSTAGTTGIAAVFIAAVVRARPSTESTETLQ